MGREVVGGALEGHNNKDGDIEKERVLQASGRKESPDSKRDLHIRFCNRVFSYFKGLIRMSH